MATLVKTAAQCAAEMAVANAKLKARLDIERKERVRKQMLAEDQKWREDFDRKAREIYLTKNAQSRLNMAAAGSGAQSTYSVLGELARAGVA